MLPLLPLRGSAEAGSAHKENHLDTVRWTLPHISLTPVTIFVEGETQPRCGRVCHIRSAFEGPCEEVYTALGCYHQGRSLPCFKAEGQDGCSRDN